MILEELVAVLTFEIDDKPLKKFQEGLGSLMGSIAVLTGTAAAAGGAIFSMAKSAADAGDNALKMSQKVGLGVERFQELAYAGKLADVSQETLGTSLKILSKNMDAAGSGAKGNAEDFAKYGIAVKKTDGTLRNTDDVLLDIADRFKDMPDGPRKTAAAMTLLGKSGTDLIPLLNGGSEAIKKASDEAREFGAVISEDSARLSEEFNDNLTRTQTLFAGLRNIVGGKFIPIINALNVKFMEWFKTNRAIIASRVDKFFNILAIYAERAWNMLSTLYDSAVGIAEVFGGLENILMAAAAAMALFAGASVLFALGKMVALVAALGHMATIANVKFLLIPILIGAAIVALGLIIEDIIAYFQGRDSVTGVIIEKFKAMFASLEEGFSGLGTAAKIGIAIILTPLRIAINMFQNLIDIINVVRGKLTFLDAAKNIAGRVLNTLGLGATDSLSGATGIPAMAMAPNAGAAAGVTPSMMDLSPKGGAGNQTNNVEMPITVNVGENVSPFEVGKEVAKQANGGFDEILRNTQRSFAGQGAY